MKTEIIQIQKKKVTFNKSLEIYSNGEDNLYPERMDRFINNSVTAKTCSNILIQYLIGKGFGEVDNFKVNQNLKLIDFADDFANSKVKQRGVYIHVNWGLNELSELKHTSLKVLPFNTCRLGLKDSTEYNGKILFSKDWEKAKKKDVIQFDVYNHDERVVLSQVEKAGGWDKYKGQVLYINDDSDYYYPLSRIDAVALDCDNENQISVYKNRLLRNGFFGKTLFLTKPLTDNTIPEFIFDPVSQKEIRNAEFLRMQSERDAFKKVLKDFLGADNADGIMHIESEHSSDNLDEIFKTVNIKTDIDPDVFKEVEITTRKNILIAFGIPEGLLSNAEGVFQNGAASLQEMKKTMWENTSKERANFLNVLNDLMSRFDGFDYGILTIKPLINEQPNNTN